MKLLKLLCFFIFTIFISSCATTSLQNVDDCSNELDRSPSAVRCEDLFKKKFKSSAAIMDDISQIDTVIISKLKLAAELLPDSITDAFWDTVVQLSENNDSKISISTSEFVLTKNFDNKIKIHSTYVYDTPSNAFIISKIEYSTPEKKKTLLSDSPINHETQKLKTDLFVDIYTNQAIKGKLSITEKIQYDVYKKILNEVKNLNLFTAHEISNIYKLKPSLRTVKYNSIAKSRVLKSYFVDNIVQDYLLNPLKTLTISFASILIFSHADFVKNAISTTHETPNWVAPSVVKMATVYPKKIQPELVSLMKIISNQDKSKNPDADKIQSLGKNKDQLKIDETDQFSIKYDSRTKKTYFFVTHEKENGQLDIYATEINPSQYPRLISHFNLEIK